MTEDIKSPKIQEIIALFEKNLEVVQKALGIEAITPDNAVGSLELEKGRAVDQVVKNNSAKKLTTSELAEQKRYLVTLRAENQARFAESQARFAESRNKFINRAKLNCQ